MVYGALEAGGTKMVCALGDENGKILEQVSIPTETPEVTLPKIVDYFKGKEIKSLGIAAFGPVDVDPASPTYGYITSTPKPGWADCNIKGYMEKALGVPTGFDHDVGGSLIGEATYGCAKGMKTAVYFTVGTGVGAGIMIDGHIHHGVACPEFGHILMRIHPEDNYKGFCVYHGSCLEGMACGPSLVERWGKPGKELKDNDKVWEIEAYYLAQACVTATVVISPQIIILGGGVMHQESLFPLIRKNVKEMLNDYVRSSATADLDKYIVPASLNDDQGIMGCIKLAIDAVN